MKSPAAQMKLPPLHWNCKSSNILMHYRTKRRMVKSSLPYYMTVGTKAADIIALDVNSKEERYVRADATCRMVAGVHSDEYAMLIGGESALAGEDYAEKNIKNYIPVALAGRVMTRAIGPVRTGDIIIPSEVPGVGRAATEGDVFSHWNIVGYAVEGDDRTDERKLRVRVGR